MPVVQPTVDDPKREKDPDAMVSPEPARTPGPHQDAETSGDDTVFWTPWHTAQEQFPPMAESSHKSRPKN